MTHLPISRIRTIMKTAEGTDFVNKDAVFLTTRATELFIKQFVQDAYKDTNGGKQINYDNLVNVVHGDSKYAFLEALIPKKITVREFKELMAKKNDGTNSSSQDSSSSGSDSDSESETAESHDSDVILIE